MILIDQLKQIYMDGVLDPLDTTNWYPKVMRKDYTVGLNITETAVDDPDPAFYENYVCGAMRNYTGYCNPELVKMIDEQSAMSDVAKRKQMVRAIEQKLADDDARPILFYPRAANCYYLKVKGLVTEANSIYNGQRFEDVWLDKLVSRMAMPQTSAKWGREMLAPCDPCLTDAKVALARQGVI